MLEALQKKSTEFYFRVTIVVLSTIILLVTLS